MNEFSVVCRVLGTLFYRQPQDPRLAPLFTLFQAGKLQQYWPLEQDELLVRLQRGSSCCLLTSTPCLSAENLVYRRSALNMLPVRAKRKCAPSCSSEVCH